MRLFLNSTTAWSECRLPRCSESTRTLPSNVHRTCPAGHRPHAPGPPRTVDVVLGDHRLSCSRWCGSCNRLPRIWPRPGFLLARAGLLFGRSGEVPAAPAETASRHASTLRSARTGSEGLWEIGAMDIRFQMHQAVVQIRGQPFRRHFGLRRRQGHGLLGFHSLGAACRRRVARCRCSRASHCRAALLRPARCPTSQPSDAAGVLLRDPAVGRRRSTDFPWSRESPGAPAATGSQWCPGAF